MQSAQGVLVSPDRAASGSRYKFRAMFERVARLRTVTAPWSDSAMWRAGYVVVFGDEREDYRAALAADIPYILIENDVATARGKDFPHEREMIEHAHAVLFAAEGHRDYCAARYEMPPCEVVHLRPLASDLEFDPLPKLEGQNIVYAGGILPSAMAAGSYGYRVYHSLFKELMHSGWAVHLYPSPATRSAAPEYEQLGCVIHDPVPMTDLYREMSQYQAGLQAYAESGSQEYIRMCVPNKVWEYLAAGIPTLGVNTGPAGALYDGIWGVVDAGDLAETTRRVLAVKVSEELRHSQVIDSDVGAFERLVRGLESLPLE